MIYCIIDGIGIVTIQHKIAFAYRRWESSLIYGNGKKKINSSKFINYQLCLNYVMAFAECSLTKDRIGIILEETKEKFYES